MSSLTLKSQCSRSRERMECFPKAQSIVTKESPRTCNSQKFLWKAKNSSPKEPKFLPWCWCLYQHPKEVCKTRIHLPEAPFQLHIFHPWMRHRSQISRGSLSIYLDLITIPQSTVFVKSLHKLLAHNDKLKHFRSLMPHPPQPLIQDREHQLAR